MLSEIEIQVLSIIGSRLLMRKDELKSALVEQGFSDGVSVAGRLNQLGYVKIVEAVGSPCYAITQEGIRTLKNGQL